MSRRLGFWLAYCLAKTRPIRVLSLYNLDYQQKFARGNLSIGWHEIPKNTNSLQHKQPTCTLAYSTRSPHKHKTQTLNFRQGTVTTAAQIQVQVTQVTDMQTIKLWGEICEQYNPDSQVGIQ